MPRPKKKEKGRGGEIRGAALGLISILILISAYALAISKRQELADITKQAVALINIISAIICGTVASKGEAKKKLYTSAAAGALMFTVIMLAAVFTDSDNISARGICEIMLISLGGSALGSMFKLCKSNKKLRRKSSR